MATRGNGSPHGHGEAVAAGLLCNPPCVTSSFYSSFEIFGKLSFFFLLSTALGTAGGHYFFFLQVEGTAELRNEIQPDFATSPLGPPPTTEAKFAQAKHNANKTLFPTDSLP